MSTISGTVVVDIQFSDSTSVTSVDRLKTISLQESTSYPTGKVAIVTGTAGTAAVTLSEYGETPYRDSSGTIVEFSAISRVAFSWSGISVRTLTDTLTSTRVGESSSGRIAVTDFAAGSIQTVISAGTGTGTYTIVLYGT